MKTGLKHLCIVVGWSCLLPLLWPLTAGSQGILEPQSVGGLRIRADSANVLLKWPSGQRESFAVLWRPNATVDARWIVLTNQMGASRTTKKTTYCDVGALDRLPAMRTNANLAGFYRVLVIPGFSFDMEGVTLSGGSQNPGQDFLPVHYQTNLTDIFQPQISLLVDGEDEGYGTEGTERVNFGTIKKPHWAVTPGFGCGTTGFQTAPIRCNF